VKFLTAIIAIVILMFAVATATADTIAPVNTTYQGKNINWWAKHAVQNRKDANARGLTIHRLKKVIAYNITINECVKLATIAYPAFTEARAEQIIRHESKGNPLAKNPHSTASGLFQFLTSTFGSTPYGKAGMSIWSPCASSLAAGWMHQNGRGGEWNY
jgi:hypothetical protein